MICNRGCSLKKIQVTKYVPLSFAICSPVSEYFIPYQMVAESDSSLFIHLFSCKRYVHFFILWLNTYNRLNYLTNCKAKLGHLTL